MAHKLFFNTIFCSFFHVTYTSSANSSISLQGYNKTKPSPGNTGMLSTLIKQQYLLKFEVLAAKMLIVVFQTVIPHSPEDGYQCF
jgi:NADH:ubiquinone oxidoreductase subunit 6 (subunit J)